MARVQPKDRVEWTAGDAREERHVRKGVVKEILPGKIALVRVRVEGEYRLEEIRMARLKKVGPKGKKKASVRRPAKKSARKLVR